MKRVLIMMIFAACASALCAADRMYCKWCGTSNFASARQLVSSPCGKSPTRKHELYSGAPRKFYVCVYCASESASFEQLVTSRCSKSPREFHDAYEGAEKAVYTCKHCASEFRSFKQLVLSPCRKGPRGYHDPL